MNALKFSELISVGNIGQLLLVNDNKLNENNQVSFVKWFKSRFKTSVDKQYDACLNVQTQINAGTLYQLEP